MDDGRGQLVVDPARRGDPFVIRLTLAFASAAHARGSLDFISRSAVPFAQMSPITDGDSSSFARVDIAVRAADRVRLMTLVTGMHGMQMSEAALEVAEVA
jgi:hypothetical protein